MSEQDPDPNTRKNEKGKGVTRDSNHGKQLDSIGKRVQESATGLIRDVFYSPGATASALSTVAGNETKSGPSGVSRSFTASSEHPGWIRPPPTFPFRSQRSLEEQEFSKRDWDRFNTFKPQESIEYLRIPSQQSLARSYTIAELDEIKETLSARRSDISFDGWTALYDEYETHVSRLNPIQRPYGEDTEVGREKTLGEKSQQEPKLPQTDVGPSPGAIPFPSMAERITNRGIVMSAFVDVDALQEVTRYWQERLESIRKGEREPKFDELGRPILDETTEEGRRQKDELIWLATKDRLTFDSFGSMEGSLYKQRKGSTHGPYQTTDPAWERLWSKRQEKEEARHQARERTQSHTDGSDVLQLLSDPEYQPGLSLDEIMAPDPANAADDEPVELSPAELAIIERLRPFLPPPLVHQTPSPTNPLNLIPDFNMDSNFAQREKTLQDIVPDGYEQTQSLRTSAYANSLTQLPSAPASELDAWFDVMKTYQDEVWGYLKPYAEAAKEEVREAETNGEPNPTGGPAVRRLGMILAHLDPRFNAKAKMV